MRLRQSFPKHLLSEAGNLGLAGLREAEEFQEAAEHSVRP